MIFSILELKDQITTTVPNSTLESMIRGIEFMVSSYTNNDFVNRYTVFSNVPSTNGKLELSSIHLKAGDSIIIRNSDGNDGLHDIREVDEIDGLLRLEVPLFDSTQTVLKVQYPMDVKMGAMNLMKWELENRSKVGIKSESLSRHNVTYFDMDASNTVNGYPASLLGFLNPYKRARF